MVPMHWMARYGKTTPFKHLDLVELRNPWNSLLSRTPASFEGGENSNDPRRCTAQSSQTGKRCKNASIPGGRVCRYHGGAAPQVIKKAQERIRELEHPAVDAIAKILDPKSPSSDAARLSAAHDILNRCGHKQPEQVELTSSTTVDVSKLS